MTTLLRRIPRWAWIIAVCVGTALALAIAIPAVLISRWLAEGERLLGEELALLDKSSEPATPADLNAYYRLPAGAVDTTDLWTQAAAAFATNEFRRDSKRLRVIEVPESPIEDPEEPRDLAPMRELLEKYRSAMDGLYEAAHRAGAARYEIHFEEGIDSDRTVPVQLNVLRWMLLLDAHVKAHDGDSEGALRAIHAMLRLSHSLQGCPDTVHQQIRVAATSTACTTLAELLPLLDVDDDALRTLARELADDNYDQTTNEMLLSERVLGLHAFDHPEVIARNARNAATLRGWSPPAHDRAYYLRHMRRLIAASRESWPKRNALVKGATDDLDVLINRSSKLVQSQYIFSRLLLPTLDARFSMTAKAVAQRDAAISALAIERYRKKTGEPPTALSDLTPDYLSAVPLDPFNGEPLRYRVDADRYLVYSVGQDLRDDGGVPEAIGDFDVVLSIKLHK